MYLSYLGGKLTEGHCVPGRVAEDLHVIKEELDGPSVLQVPVLGELANRLQPSCRAGTTTVWSLCEMGNSVTLLKDFTVN